MKKHYLNLLTVVVLTMVICFTSCDNEADIPREKEEVVVEKNPKIFVKGGTYLMGLPDGEGDDDWSRPQHKVTLSDFYISTYEVTNAEYAEFLNEKGNTLYEGSQGEEFYGLDTDQEYCQIEEVDGKFKAKEGKEDYPVIFVTWEGAKAYCEWKGGRLPTEAEWEYAARGGEKSKKYKYAGSNNIDEVAWYENNSENPENVLQDEKGRGTHKVGKKQPNELGIYDMSGNVWEWCYDLDGEYTAEDQVNPTGPAESDFPYRILRGGSWFGYDTNAEVIFRHAAGNLFVDDATGFRVVYDKK